MLIFLDAHFFALPLWLRLLVASISIAAIGGLAYWKRQLTVSGLLAAVIMGLVTIMTGGYASLSLYLFFLLSAAVIGHLSKRISGLEKIHKKGGRRDWVQVMANGGPALVAMLIFFFTDNNLGLAVFCACLGEACGDTWASEIGVLSKKDPVSILTFTRVPRGLSGGISALGTGAAFLSCLFYGLFALSCYPVLNILDASIVTVCAFIGVLADSILGATLQAHYYNEEEDLVTEHSKDREGKELKLVRGLPFMDNDMVNLSSNIIVFLLSWGLLSLLS